MANKTLVVVESPAKMKTIQKYLGDSYVVRASVGHVVDLASTPKNRLGVDLDNGFKPNYAVIPEKKDKVGAIIDASKGVSQIFLASDPDREGEAIAWHIAQLLKTKIPIKRVLFHEITKKGIKDGISNPLELNKNLFDAQQARRVLDRLVGYMVSPYLMDNFGPNLSAGRVQSVAIRMIVDREREIESFKPEEYWSITTALAKPSALTDGFIAKYSQKITNKLDASKIKNDLDKDTYEILEVIAEEKKKSPFPPLETSSLQQAAALKFSLPATKTMRAAQTLYESGIVTYIRTDSVRCSPESIQSLRDWLSGNGFQVPEKPHHYNSKGDAQDAHEAIRPTDINLKPEKLSLGDDEKKVYSLIWERFVASQMEPAIFDTVSVTVKSSSGHILKAHGRTLKYKGWTAITGELEKKEEEEEAKLPALKKGDVVVLIPPKVKADQKFTQPPSRYKEHSLIKELKKRGIGRPSTYAATMAKLTDRSYVEKKKDTFHPTELGKKVVDSLVKFFDFMEYQYTANMETQLDQIEEGKLGYLQMMSSFFPQFKNQLSKAYSSNIQDYGIKCYKCQSPMRLKHGKFGYYMACSDYPNCKTSQSCEIVNGNPVLKESHYSKQNVIEGTSCPKCQSGMLVRDGKFGKFYSCSKYPKCNGSAKMPFGKKCHKCGNDLFLTVFNGEPKLACMGYPSCRNVEEVPADTKVNWIDPKKISNKTPKKIQKVLNSSRA